MTKIDHQLKNQIQWIPLSIAEAKRLVTYYIVLLIVSFFILILALWYNYNINSFSSITGMIIFSITPSLLGSGIYYIRKFYKSCIQLLLLEPSDSYENNIQRLGAKIYFYLRPLISSILAFLILLGIYSGFYILETVPSISDKKYFAFCILLSFYVGFCNGKIIINLDSQGEKLLKFLSGENKNGTE